jgi:hypothetical protein
MLKTLVKDCLRFANRKSIDGQDKFLSLKISRGKEFYSPSTFRVRLSKRVTDET